MSGEVNSKWSVKPRREAPATPDLLVCFPSRAHMSLISKPICSPGRTHDPSKRFRSGSKRSGFGNPLFRTKNKLTGTEQDEPTSPKVTCAGQIRVKPRTCRNWQSVMEEIERIHENGKNRKSERPNKRDLSSSVGSKFLVEALGFKRDVMQFLGALRKLRFDFRCFGSTHLSDNESCDENEEHEVGNEEQGVEGGSSRMIFSKWFMVLQENQDNGLSKNEIFRRDELKKEEKVAEEEEEEEEEEVVVPPPNALLLMRCRSAPANGRLSEESLCVKASEKKKEERLVLMSYAPDFFKGSLEIAKETWVGKTDPFLRSKSWKR